MIQALIDNPEKRSLKALQEIRREINSLPKSVKRDIWGSLYHGCAKGTIEDAWSEYHFHEFLPYWRPLIQEKRSLADDWISNAEEQFMSNFADSNFSSNSYSAGPT